MASPVRAGTQVSDSGGSGVSNLSHTAVGSIVAGDYLVIQTTCECNNPTAATLTLHADAVSDGWVKLVGVGSAASDVTTAVFYKRVAVSGDTGKAVVIETSATGEMLGWFHRITGAFDAVPEANDTSITTGTSHTLPNVSSTTDDTLGLYILGFDGGDGDPFGAPGGNWTEQDEHNSGITANDSSGVYGDQSKGTAGAYGAPVISSNISDGAASIVFVLASTAASTPVTVVVTGIAATGSPGTVTVDAEAIVGITGTAATGATGTATVEAKADVGVIGLGSTGAVGSATTEAKAVIQPTGVAATGQAGTVIVTGVANVGVTGIGSTGAVGSVVGTPSWTWDAGHFTFDDGTNHSFDGWHVDVVSIDVTVSVTGIAGTGAVGTVTVEAKAIIPVTGITATGAAGTTTVEAKANVPVTGLAATGSPGTTTVDAEATAFAASGGVNNYFLGPTTQDDQAVWANDANAADGSISTFSEVTVFGSAINNELRVSLINAPAGGGEITAVRGRVYGGLSTTGSESITTQFVLPSRADQFGDNPDLTPGWSAYKDLGTGYSWSEIGQIISAHYVQDAGGTLSWARVYKTEIEVTSTVGLEATASVGSVTISAVRVADVPVNGVSATGAVGAVTVGVSATAAVNGLAATGNSGTVAVTTEQTLDLTGLEATGSVGTVTVSLPKVVPVTGLVATANPGTVTVEGKAIVPVTGIAATGAVGEVTVDAGGAVVVQVVGLGATGSAGSVTTVGEANVPITGISATGSVGTTTVAVETVVPVTGIAATGAVGAVTVVTFNLPATYYFDTSDEGPTDASGHWINDANTFDGSTSTFSESFSPDSGALTGGGTIAPATGPTIGQVDARVFSWTGSGSSKIDVEIFTDGQAQSLVAWSEPQSDPAAFGSFQTLITPTGGWTWPKIAALEAHVSRDPASPASVRMYRIEVEVSNTGDVTVAVTGVSGTGTVGTTTTEAKANVLVTGIGATGSPGTVAVVIPTPVTVVVAGVSATGNVGTVAVTAEAIVPVTGIVTTSAVGTVIVDAATNVVVAVSGIAATGAVGAVLTEAQAIVEVAGLVATGVVGFALGYGHHVPGQDPNYVDLTPSQDPTWIAIGPTQTPAYDEIEPTQDPLWTEVDTG